MSWTRVDNKDELERFYISVLPKIRAAAKAEGYAVGVHGSMRRDLDLIATPWIDDHSDKDLLARVIHRAACGFENTSYDWENKPCGRVATVFPIVLTWHDGSMILSNGHVDLSVVSAIDKALEGDG